MLWYRIMKTSRCARYSRKRRSRSRIGWSTTVKSLPSGGSRKQVYSMRSERCGTQVRCKRVSVVGGVWHNLDYAHQLGFGTRAMVQMAVMPKLEEFRTLANTLMDTPSLTDAADLVQQSIRIIESGTTTLLHDSQSLGRTIYAEHMDDDTKLWDSCVQQWGQRLGIS